MGSCRRGATPAAAWLVAAIVAGAAASRDAAATPQQSGEDFYDAGGHRVVLRRSSAELVLRFTSGERQDHERTLGLVTRQLQIDREIRDRGRLFYVVALDPPDAAAVPRLIAQLAAQPGVGFAGAVYADAVTRTRMIPTGEIVARLKAGVDRRRLERLAVAHALTIAGTLTGASGEYVLRLNETSGSIFQLVRELTASGLFSWVQPDFLRELQVEPLEDATDLARGVDGAAVRVDVHVSQP